MDGAAHTVNHCRRTRQGAAEEGKKAAAALISNSSLHQRSSALCQAALTQRGQVDGQVFGGFTTVAAAAWRTGLGRSSLPSVCAAPAWACGGRRRASPASRRGATGAWALGRGRLAAWLRAAGAAAAAVAGGAAAPVAGVARSAAVVEGADRAGGVLACWRVPCLRSRLEAQHCLRGGGQAVRAGGAVVAEPDWPWGVQGKTLSDERDLTKASDGGERSGR
eukprot:6200678-Pleurochrysis_carterae.AAC.7